MIVFTNVCISSEFWMELFFSHGEFVNEFLFYTLVLFTKAIFPLSTVNELH